jgi:ABC-2 type transport system permease protein
MLVVLALGLAMFLSASFVRYRDVEPIWDVILQALFYATPILYTAQTVIDKAGIEVARILMLNPLATVIQQARHAVVDPAYAGVGQIFGTPAWAAVPVAATVVIFVLGLVVFRRAAPSLAEDL